MKMLYGIPGLPVSDMERSTAFYRDKLGFTVAVQKVDGPKLQLDTVSHELGHELALADLDQRTSSALH